MPRLDTTISRGLWTGLIKYAERTQEPLAHIVSKALAEHLGTSHHTLFQVSTSTALVEGIHQGAVPAERAVATGRSGHELAQPYFLLREGETSTNSWSHPEC